MRKSEPRAQKRDQRRNEEQNKGREMAGGRFRNVLGIFVLSGILAGCAESTGQFPLFKGKNGGNDTASRASSTSTRLVERDVEAPDVFQVTETGLWDGRPSLGGVWVAHPDVKDPERVIIRNEANGKFVIGALFRRERENPGPSIQISSDAADAIEILAGQPTLLNVTALRKEEVPDPETAPTLATIAADDDIEASALGPLEAAAAALEQVETGETEEVAAIQPAAATAVNLPNQSSLMAKPYLQIGFYSVEANATRTGERLRQDGMVPIIKRQDSKGKTFWRVIVGPSSTPIERGQLLKKIKALGYSDAYAVSG